MSDYHVRTTCRLCDAPLPEERCLDLGETPLSNEYLDTAEASLNQQRFPLYLKQCTACGHVQLPIVVNPGRLWGPKYAYQSGTSPVFRKHLEELADEIAAIAGKDTRNGAVLEIGCNDGTLIQQLEYHGLMPTGVDPSYTGDHGGIIRESWPCNVGTQKYKVIVALNVFAHVDNLRGFTAAIAEALAPDGVCIVEVGYLPDVIERGLFDTVYLEHCSYHHLTPLLPFFQRHGLEVFDAKRIESQGGSVRIYLKRGPVGMTKTLYELVEAETGLDVGKLRQRIDSTRNVFRLFDYYRNSKGLPYIDIYGCPAKLTTLLSVIGEFERSDYGRTVIYDDNPLKVGKFAPGTYLPIVPSQQMQDRQPAYCLIASWNFASEIMKRQREIGFRGKFIVPIPEVRIYGP